MPGLFYIFNFDYIEKFEHKLTRTTSASGAAIPATTLYTCPEGRFTLFLDIHVNSTKTTSTAFACYIARKDAISAVISNQQILAETLGTTEAYLNWPMGKASTNWSLGPTLLFLFPGDTLVITHALTAAETIVDIVGFTYIEYKNPQYGK